MSARNLSRVRRRRHRLWSQPRPGRRRSWPTWVACRRTYYPVQEVPTIVGRWRPGPSSSLLDSLPSLATTMCVMGAVAHQLHQQE